MNWFRRTVRMQLARLGNWVWLVYIGFIAIILVGWSFINPNREEPPPPEVVEATLEMVSTESNENIATIAAGVTLTPQDLWLTEVAPTLEVIGRAEVRQFAAAAVTDSERDDIDWGAVQAAGPPNTEECGDFFTAWASADPNQRATIHLYYSQLVVPTGILIYQSNNPGFIQQVVITDILGERHIVYENVPRPVPCNIGFPLVIPIQEAEYATNTITIIVDQTTSLNGANQIDAVELIGIRY